MLELKHFYLTLFKFGQINIYYFKSKFKHIYKWIRKIWTFNFDQIYYKWTSERLNYNKLTFKTFSQKSQISSQTLTTYSRISKE